MTDKTEVTEVDLSALARGLRHRPGRDDPSSSHYVRAWDAGWAAAMESIAQRLGLTDEDLIALADSPPSVIAYVPAL